MLSFFTRTRYRKDIISVLLIKLIALFLLWMLFFAHPVDESLTKNQLTEWMVTNVK